MPKYYVQSGSFRGVVVRESQQAAAQWAVEFVMKQSDANRSDSSSIEDSHSDIGLFRLGKTIGVSQRGFSRKDRTRIATSAAVLDWMIDQHASPKP
jgi:hypothetical protein